MRKLNDRVGLGFRAELAPSILVNLDSIDLVEVMADDFFSAPEANLRALRTMHVQVPVTLHGVGLGLATSQPVCEKHLTKLARLLEAIDFPTWSEHLAFVRSGGIEIGHLCAPPRNNETIEGTLRNLERVKKVCGSLPALENVATLLEPPGSIFSEAVFHQEIFRRSGCDFLVDLHNLYANCVNFRRDPFRELSLLPLDRITSVHLSGGHWIKEQGGKKERLLDDHVHSVPAEVFSLLERLAALTPLPLDVIIERDGRYPPFPVLLGELERARECLVRGRKTIIPSLAKEAPRERAAL